MEMKSKKWKIETNENVVNKTENVQKILKYINMCAICRKNKKNC